MAACSKRDTNSHELIVNKEENSPADVDSATVLSPKIVDNSKKGYQSSKQSLLQGSKCMSNKEQLTNLPLDEYMQLLEEAYQNKRDGSPMLQQIYNEVETTEKDNAKCYGEETKRVRHQNKKSKSMNSEICGDYNSNRNLINRRKNVNRGSYTDGNKTREINNMKKCSGHSVMDKSDQHSQSLQDITSIVGCDKIKSAGVGKNVHKVHNKTVRANSFTHETCIPFENKKKMHSCDVSSNMYKNLMKSKQKQCDKLTSSNMPSLENLNVNQTNIHHNLTNANEVIEESNSLKGGVLIDKLNPVKIDMNIDDEEDDEMSKETIPLLQNSDKSFESAVTLNSINRDYQAVDRCISLPLQPIKSSKSMKNCISLKDGAKFSYDKANDIDSKNFSNQSDLNVGDKSVFLIKDSNEDYSSSKEDKKKKKREDVRRLDQNGNPIADNTVRKLGSIPTNALVDVPRNSTTVYPANPTINLLPANAEQDSSTNGRKSKIRGNHKGNVIKPEEMPGYFGNAPIECILDFINSSDKNLKRNSKENGVILSDCKKQVDKKEIKKKKKLSQSNSVADDECWSKTNDNNPSNCVSKASTEESFKPDMMDSNANDYSSFNCTSVEFVSQENEPMCENLQAPSNVLNFSNECAMSSRHSSDKPNRNFDFADDMAQFGAVFDNAINSFDDSNEFREVKNKKIRKRNKKNRIIRNMYGQQISASSESYRNEHSDCYTSSGNNEDILMLDRIALSHRSRTKSNERSRRKSTSSMPPSEHSSAENSDLDSVHSLPVVSKTAPPKRIRLPHTTPSSSSSTPHTSYADIAKISMCGSHRSNSTSSSVNPFQSAVIIEPDDFDSVPVSNLTLENVERKNQIDIEKFECYFKNDAFISKEMEENSSKVMSDEKKKATGDNPGSSNHSESKNDSVNSTFSDSLSATDAKANDSEFPPLLLNQKDASEANLDSDKDINKTTPLPQTAVTKNKSLSDSHCCRTSTYSRPPVIIMDNFLCNENHCDFELTFGFEVNESLLKMNFSDAPIVSSISERINENDNLGDMKPSFISPIYKPNENPEYDRSTYNYLENIKFIGSAWKDVQCKLDIDLKNRKVFYYNCNKY